MSILLSNNQPVHWLAGLRPKYRNAFKIVLASSALVFFSCENYRPADPVITEYVKVANVNRDTVIVIPNEKSATNARITFTETLSDTATRQDLIRHGILKKWVPLFASHNQSSFDVHLWPDRGLLVYKISTVQKNDFQRSYC